MARTPTATASSADVRRWIRRRRIAANGRMEPGTVYSIALAVAMAVALVGQPVLAAIWPSTPPADRTVSVLAIAGGGLVLAAFFRILRQLGPLSISRSDAAWLLPAPVSRRRLLGPALGIVVATAVVVGGLAGLAVTGRVVERPASAMAILTGIIAGIAAAMFVALVTMRCQRRPALGRAADLVVGIIASVLVLAAVATQSIGVDPLPLALRQPGPLDLGLTGLALAAAAGATLLAWRGLDGWPTHQIAAASAVTGAYADALYAVEPSFLAESSTRRYWQRRASFSPSGLFRRDLLPPLVTQDLLIARRKATRFWWLAGTALAPTVLAGAPSWLLVGILLVGALGAAGMTTESTHSDARNPAMLRLLGMSGRQVLAQRLVVPSAIAAAWGAVALIGLQVAGRLDGPWWALGIVAGPTVAVAALHRARASAASIGHIFIDTPLGAFPSGMLLWLVNGVDVLTLLTLPVFVALAVTAAPEALSWYPVLVQALASALGCVLLIRWSAARAGALGN